MPRPKGHDDCTIADCPQTHHANGYCAMHYARSKRSRQMASPHRTLLPVKTVGGAHKRIYTLWGKASQYVCIACGGPAQEWAYDGADPTESYECASNADSWQFFSSWPEFYMPLCRRCHKGRDAAIAKQELREYREWKHRTGLTLADVSGIKEEA